MKVSIIVPIYNVAPYIEDCLRSVAEQTMTEGVECILVDDCGADNSVAVYPLYSNTRLCHSKTHKRYWAIVA